MQAKVYCKTVAKGRQAFYINANGKEYFLFEQDFRASNKEFFKKGYYLTDRVDYTRVRSEATRRTLEKLPSKSSYIDRSVIGIRSTQNKPYDAVMKNLAERIKG